MRAVAVLAVNPNITLPAALLEILVGEPQTVTEPMDLVAEVVAELATPADTVPAVMVDVDLPISNIQHRKSST